MNAKHVIKPRVDRIDGPEVQDRIEMGMLLEQSAMKGNKKVFIDRANSTGLKPSGKKGVGYGIER